MQLVRNDRLIRNRVRLASAAHVGALAIFGGSLLVTMQPWYEQEQWWWAYSAIVLGLLLYNFGQHHLRRYGPKFRLDGAFTQALKGLDARYTLFAFVSPKLPDLLIVGPNGVHAIVPRTQSGSIVCRADRWSRIRGRFGLLGALFVQPLRNPSQDARRAVERTRQFLEPRLGEDAESIAFHAAIVFAHPQARLRIDGCSYPVTTLKELRNHLRKAKASLSTKQVARVAKAIQQEIRA